MRTIPLALQEALDKPVQRTTRLVRFDLDNGEHYGVTMLDRDVVYDHGDGVGPITYSASNGIDPSVIASDLAYKVANGEGRMFVGSPGFGITAQMVEAGLLDDCQWKCFIVDLENLTTGSAMVLDAGDVGEVSVERGIVLIPELLSYSMRLNQPVGSVWQRPCRAVFGKERAHPLGCGYDAESLWVDFEVMAVGAEPNRLFEIEFTSGMVDNLFPGRVVWESGPNASQRMYSLEGAQEDSSGVNVVLSDETPYPIQVGHTGRIRPDCTKLVDGVNGCKYWDNYINFNGEDKMPVGDAASSTFPGAGLPLGGGYVGEVPPEAP